MPTVLDIIQKTTDFLAARGVEGPRLNAELLIGHALGLKRMQLYLQFERGLDEPELERIRSLVRRRGQREPLQYITGEVEFGGLRLKVDRRALIPRPETEYLIELVSARLTVPPTSILDLGTGSGAIALALAARQPQAKVTAVDLSPDALALATENAVAAGLTERVVFLASDWFSALPDGARYDLIVANPPYLSAEETASAAPEVSRYEPVSALMAEEEGMAALKIILREACTRLAAGGLLALETGIAHHGALLTLAASEGYVATESRPDLTGRDRYVFTRREAIVAQGQHG